MKAKNSIVFHVGGIHAENLNAAAHSDGTEKEFEHLDIDLTNALQACRQQTKRGLYAICLYPKTMDGTTMQSPFPACEFQRALRKMDVHMARRSLFCVEAGDSIDRYENRFVNSGVIPPYADIDIDEDFPVNLKKALLDLGEPLSPIHWRRWLEQGAERFMNPKLKYVIDFAKAAKVFDNIVGNDDTEDIHGQMQRVNALREGGNWGYLCAKANQFSTVQQISAGVIVDIRRAGRAVENTRRCRASSLWNKTL